MELLRAVLSGEAPQPPLSRLIGLALAKADDGTTTFTLPLTDWLCDPDGSISLGPPMIVADAPMARAAIT